jgi:hypothetical protein
MYSLPILIFGIVKLALKKEKDNVLFIMSLILLIILSLYSIMLFVNYYIQIDYLDAFLNKISMYPNLFSCFFIVILMFYIVFKKRKKKIKV